MMYRGRRLRRTPTLREMMRETVLRPEDLIMPYFAVETDQPNVRNPISSMPGQFQLSLDALEQTVAEAVDAGLRSCLLFGIPAEKDPAGSGAYAENGIVQQAVWRLKNRFPALKVITDVCLCEYTSHGHCGLVTDRGEVRNDATLRLLADTAVSHARAGADMVAPSDMMDGRVGEALREAAADVDEGADILMVKPAGPYLDIIRDVREAFDLPVAAYQVSGEYAMIASAGIHGWIDRDAVMLESLLGIKRAGAKLIISYFTQEILQKGLLS